MLVKSTAGFPQAAGQLSRRMAVMSQSAILGEFDPRGGDTG
jgi:hypothetical protein